MKKINKYIYFIFFFLFILEEILALELNGDYMQGGLIFGKINSTGKVYFDNKDLINCLL